ncbi:hypothetical protein [Roseomonas populi]|uniref:DUF2892 domain-containing protein n=1 Tax=Roseomonas populi TaxID=3121582 RepID=A0ABT1XCN0_9PROT|nr:hypothetical protein [Roseomonas pecuniae]MCR0985865.1 hypothetical protein [Roseomonas pecuniae]
MDPATARRVKVAREMLAQVGGILRVIGGFAALGFVNMHYGGILPPVALWAMEKRSGSNLAFDIKRSTRDAIARSRALLDLPVYPWLPPRTQVPVLDPPAEEVMPAEARQD